MAKKVGIVTIHTTFNYGAVLQAIATVAFFRNRGYDAELIDYTNDHIQEQLRLSYRQDGKVLGYFKTFVRNTIFGRLKYYRQAFKGIDQYYHLSKRYESKEDLEGESFDILVSGSDQLWNPLITGDMDPVFMLDFGNCTKRISLASSIGSTALAPDDLTKLVTALNQFDHISVRESFAKKQLQQHIEKEIKVLADPTLLLDRDYWWDELASKSTYANTKEKYIVTYFAGGNKAAHREIIKQYSEKLKLPVWTIQYSNYTWKESNKKILGATAEDFVALIANAELVITDSFHGTAFSLNMGSNFVSLTNKANPVRVKELLEKMDLLDRIDMKPEFYKEVDYTEVGDRLDAFRQDSISWLENIALG